MTVSPPAAHPQHRAPTPGDGYDAVTAGSGSGYVAGPDAAGSTLAARVLAAVERGDAGTNFGLCRLLGADRRDMAAVLSALTRAGLLERHKVVIDGRYLPRYRIAS